MRGLKAFREAYMSADPTDDRDFASVDARRLRYALLWAFYENTAYRDIHSFAPKLRADYGLYKHIRGIHNPAYRLVEFHVTHLLGGALDPEAGDGKRTPSALPILTDNSALRPAIARLWRDSNWGALKPIWTRYGAGLGDVGLQVIDDPVRERVYLKVVHPASIRDVELDTWGNVKAYVIEELRPDPAHAMDRFVVNPAREVPMVRYTEIAMRDDDDVVYQTFRDGRPFDWSGGDQPEWAEPYGFVPLVLTQHLDVGLDFGWSELHAGLAKFREVDDQASKLSDQVRKMVDAPWLFTGITAPANTPKTKSATQGEGGRQELPALYGPSGADAKPLVAPLSIGEVAERTKDLIAELERDYPELQMDIWAAGNVSGRALRVARQRVTTKIQGRRTGYDASLVKAHQMAVAIGGMRGYEGYQGFSLDSYAGGQLDHQIGERPVFDADPLDDIEIEAEFWGAAKAAKDADYPLELFLEDRGWEQGRIKRYLDAKAARQAEAQQLAVQQGQPGTVAGRPTSDSAQQPPQTAQEGQEPARRAEEPTDA